MSIRLIPVVAAALMLASCIGDDGDPNIPTLSDARLVSPALVEAAGLRGATNAPDFTHARSISQSSVPASVSTVFDGSDVKLTVERTTGSDISLDSATDSVAETLNRYPLPSSPISGHTMRDWTMFDHSRAGTSAAHVTLTWNESGDPTDYLAAGYWMHLNGVVSAGSIAGAEIGAFVDGPEFSSAPALPALGTASYKGHASGFYTVYYGPAWQHLPVPEGVELPAGGTWEVGAYTGIATLTANFDSNTVSGCIGCMLPGEDPQTILLEVAGDTIDANGDRGELYFAYINTPGRNFARIILEDAPIDSASGTFSGSDLTLEIDYFPAQTGSTSSGTWGGRFSSIPDGSGDPRLVAGTSAAEWNNPSAGSAMFIGTFFAATPEQDQ